jgi:hypothetical protein
MPSKKKRALPAGLLAYMAAKRAAAKSGPKVKASPQKTGKKSKKKSSRTQPTAPHQTPSTKLGTGNLFL